MEVVELLEEINENLEEIRKGIEDMGGDNARIMNSLENIESNLED